ncbi:NAD(P)-binding protein [Metschnikowia bicuspidata var. bicuspidata NRRL YB-4993]|uniref:NAD(P)-binding protein n=1 Tax=Metschnikowia bicuspidata var. bicuspidata NRRL YB-4993 TaxID=869754 RepID=A0A1A0HJQ6_9ASCO|nr:NAD(P)-binding protein [Metschnikowia bicuspidata var. bicuspidata NRRL YB-4993]OBA24048.1 NAD(P)-binding protein [Metschnikowia bicuspidata var. bicuspidata NRRL YB-4993]
MTTSVFVSGATGYIAQHVIKLLVTKGYNVVGSVRTAEKGKNLVKLFDTGSFTYEVVPKLEAPGAFDQALEKHPEVSVFLHTASPVSFNVQDVEKELLLPAVEGTKNVFSAIKAHGSQIKHVVVTSSVAALLNPARNQDPTFTVNEDSWNPITWEQAKENAMNGYFGSKKFAEKAAWDFLESEKPNFTLNTVLPVYVFGPQAFDSEVKGELNYSAEIINKLLKLGPNDEVPAQQGAFVDVRDVAKAHLAAFEGGLSNQRLLLRTGGFTAQRVLDIINAKFVNLRGQLPTGTPEKGEPENTGSKTDNSRTKELLNYPAIDLENCVVDSVTQLVKSQKKVF